MTRILRLLMIAAIALPLWQPMVAQEVASAGSISSVNAASFEKRIETGEQIVAQPLGVASSNAKSSANFVGSSVSKVKAGNTANLPVKLVGKPMKTSVKKSNAKGNVGTKADIPERYVEIIFHVENVWNDGSGYQLLIGPESSLTSYISGNTWNVNAIYSAVVYSVPEDADYSSTGNATNMIVEGTQSIMIPAGTYDYVVSNPTPGDKIYCATFDTYTFNAGGSYEFHIYSNNGAETLDINVTEPSSSDVVGIPTNLAAYPDATSANIYWDSGDNNESWNLRYRETGGYNSNRFWDFESESQIVDFTMLDIDGDGYNWGRNGGSASLKVQSGSYIMQSASYLNYIGALTPNNWLITPKVKLGGSVSFYACGQDNTDYSEKFGVYVCQGDTWTSVSDFVQVGNDRTTGSSMTKYTFDLSSYSGPGYIAIVHHNITDMFFLNIDDIEVLVPDAQTENEWIYVNDVTNPHTITGLTTGTTYEVQVQGVGNNTTTDWTSSVLFTPFVVAPRDIVVKDAEFFEGKTYTWEEDGQTKSANLTEIATTPKQMIAMLTKIYIDQTIPGNKKRGFDALGNDEPWNDCYYSGVGTIKKTGSTATSASSYSSTNNIYGWNIPGNIKSYNDNGLYAFYMDTTQYRPYDEGLTLILVEMKDDFDASDLNNVDQSDLETYLANTIKSARVITEARRTGTGLKAGTLFKIDCDKMNKFFLLAKGQLRWVNNMCETYVREKNSYTYYYLGDEVAAPAYYYMNNSNLYSQGSGGNTFFTNYGGTYYYYDPPFADNYAHPLFYHMFEQFSPVANDSQVAKADIYQDLINMESFGVEHDCMSIAPIMGHQFEMYGEDSGYEDCQDVRDLMFFIPDYRMMKDDNRDPASYEKFLNYNRNCQPTMGLFVIKQNEITGEQIDGQDTYKLHLTWDSNLLDFLPSEDGKYKLYRVITNPDGTKTYQQVGGNFNPNTFEYYDSIPMQHNGQQVTYVVQGQDWDGFLDLQMSNEESYIIPGLDRAEQIRIDLNSDYYFSRYDAADQTNNYSNSLIANNTVGTNVKPNYIKNGSQFKFWRATLKEVEENGVTSTVVDTEHAVNFVIATVGEDYNPTTGGTLTYAEVEGTQTDFSNKPYGHGYHANPTTSTISVSNGEVVFDGLKLYDNFSVSVANNDHPTQYVYYVTLETAVPFELGGNGIPDCATAQSGTYAYFECAWGSTMRAWAWNDNGNLTGNDWPGTGTMTQVGTHNGNKVWLWTADASVKPTGIKFNWDNASNMEQTGNYQFTNGGYYKHESDVVSVVGSNQARSNTVSVPVYKTEMTMNPISAAQVEADVTHELPAGTKFELDAQYSSRSEILGYYIYRWADNDQDQPRTIYESNGDDASPQGQAGNQGTYYTVAMNTDYTAQTQDFGSNYAPVTASFEDNYMVNNATIDADTYTYAPVVELFAPIQAVNLSDNSDRVDYNTYGGPQQMTAGGKIEVEVESSATTGPDGYEWTMNGSTYVYYNTLLKVKVLDLPEGYEVAKVRAWRKVNANNFLGEQEPTQNTPDYRYRANLDANGEFMFSNYYTSAYDTNSRYDIQVGGCIGGEEDDNHIMAGTFGGKKLNSGEEVDMDFIVRIYFTKTDGAKAGEQPYYIAEVTATDVLTSNIPTSITGVESYCNVVSEKYYNPAGIESDTPFKGVNIVVTRYSDGSTTTTKILK